MDSSSSSTKIKPKLSPTNQTSFKKSSVSKKITNLSMRQQTLVKKASELSTLCDIEVCVIYYDRDRELVKTWPEDQSRVRDMAERFSKLTDKERHKKSSNLYQFLTKKILDNRKHDNKFSETLLEMENSLENHLRVFQDKLHRLSHPEKQTEPDQSRTVSSGFFSENLLSPEEPNQQWTESLISHKNDDEYRLEKDLEGFAIDLSPSESLMSFMNDDEYRLEKDLEGCAIDLSPSESLMSFMNDDEYRLDQDLSLTGGFTTDLSPCLINNPHEQWTESLISYKNGDECRLKQDLSLTGGFTTDVSPCLINDPHQQQWTESLISYKSDDECRLEQDLSLTGGFTTDLSPCLINNPHQQQWTESIMSGMSSTEKDLSLNQHQNKFTFFLYNHDNATFSQLGDSVSSFDQLTPPLPDNLTTALLGAQGLGLRSSNNNNNIDLPTLQMQTQNPLVHFDQFGMWNQTPSFGDAMPFSSYS